MRPWAVVGLCLGGTSGSMACPKLLILDPYPFGLPTIMTVADVCYTRIYLGSARHRILPTSGQLPATRATKLPPQAGTFATTPTP